MSPSKPAVLLIPGAWHVPASYNKLTNLLKSSGHDIHVPSLPSMNGARPPTADLETDTAHIREYTQQLADAGQHVVIIAHSYSGQIASNSLTGLWATTRAQQGLPGGVVHIISLCAFMVREGFSMTDVVHHFGHDDYMPLAYDFAEDQTVVDRDPKGRLVSPGPGDDDVEVEGYLGTLKRWNGKCMSQGLSTDRVAWRDIPVTYVHTIGDMTTPLAYQQWMVGNMKEDGVEVETVELDTGHSPNLTKAKEVAEIVDMVVARYKK
ncbi:alpha/beta hydrolase [Aspergillus ibericus CBS 121593]|uniref:Alpha/beta-hydrolase n=1 Tax=Aspergillus ibericus CBS 121593 TaxID=1448316 RepID=A0A395GJI0_9EURO|nr:alpha/beta-hydrolase [Aspergillus ibericus CBS 121593]RAK95641.1 alpha/beta-hydrolase [Aspergillus ibericus CBS 121593]